jgi:uroporphyrinogen decarboxylase
VDVPVIGFARGLGAAQEAFVKGAGVAAAGCEWQLPVDYMAKLAKVAAVQGNLDPAAVMAGDPYLREGIERLVKAIPRERHIFNLGHGFKPETPIENVEKMVAYLREFDGAV